MHVDWCSVKWDAFDISPFLTAPAALNWSFGVPKPATLQTELETSEAQRTVHSCFLYGKGKYGQDMVVLKNHLGLPSVVSTTKLLSRADWQHKCSHTILSSSERMWLLKSCYWFYKFLQVFFITGNLKNFTLNFIAMWFIFPHQKHLNVVFSTLFFLVILIIKLC